MGSGDETTVGLAHARLIRDGCTTVDREIFMLKIIHVKNFLVKFSQFYSIREIFLKVADYNMDEHLESSYRLVYYLGSREPGIAGCSCRSDIYPGECGLVRTSLFIDHRSVSLIFAC